MHFQGRLRNASQGIVPDGDYNLRFKIYSGGDGQLGGGDETLEWTETYDSTNQLRVENGYFSTQLGSITSLAGVDFTNDTLWLSLDVGGTSGTPSWDGEMDPFIRLSATPYAFQAGNSDTLDSYDSLDFARLDEAANFTAALQQAGSNVCTEAGNCSIGDGVGSGDAFLQGGNSFGAVATLGTNDMFDLAFETNGAEHMRIDTAGEVGIGTTTPGYKLDVQNGTGIVGRFSGRVIGADAVNTDEFATLGQVNSATADSTKVASLNTFTGDLTVQGTAGKVTVSDNGTDTLTINLHADVSLLGQTIEGSEITDNTITNADIAADTIGATEIATDAVGSDEISDNAIQEIDLETTNAATDNYVLSYDSTSGGFTWVVDDTGTDTQLSELEVEAYIFDGDNTGTLSSGTLALDSLSYTGQLGDTNIADALTISSSGSVADGALSPNVSLLGQSIDSGEITDGTIQEVELNTTNVATDNYVLSYDSGTGGFTWVQDADTQVTETEVEGFIFDGDNTGTLSSGTLALGSLSFTGNLTDTYVSDTLTIGSGSTVDDGALSSNVTLLGQSIDSSEITDNTVQEVDLETTNIATDNYVLSYDTTSGGFTWVEDADTQLSELEVEGFIFDGDNTGTLSSGTLALDSLSFTGNLTDTYISDTLTIGSGSSVADGALSANVALLDRITQTFTGNNTFSGTTTLSSLDCTTFANGGTLTTNGTGEVICADDDGGSGAGEVSSLNSLDGVLTLQGTTNEIEITDNSTDTITVGLPNSVTIDTLTLTNALTIGNGGTGATTIGSAGSIAYSDGSMYNFTSQGSSGQCLVSNGSGIPSWGNCSGSGAGAVTLQKAYDNGSTINTTNPGGDIAFTLEDTSTNHNFTVDIADGATGTASINRLNGTGTADPAHLLALNNQDTDRSIADGLLIQAAGGGLTDGIDASDADITNAINIGANTIQGTNGVIDFNNFDVDGTGNVTLAGTLQLSGLNCTTNANGGALTTNSSGQVICSDDNGGSGSGVDTIGTMDSQVKSADGAVVSGTTLYLQSADASFPGLVSTGAQTFAGDKTFNGVVSVPGTGTISEQFGAGASASGYGSLALGYDATAAAGSSIAIGESSSVSVTNDNSIAIGQTSYSSSPLSISLGKGAGTYGTGSNIAIGANSSAGDAFSIAIGSYAQSLSSSIALGGEANASLENTLVAGSNSAPINTIFFGKGISNSTPTAFTLQGTGGSGTDVAGADINIAGGRGTGTGAGGGIVFQTAPAGTTGSSQNALVDRMIIGSDGNVGIGTSSTPGATLSVGGTTGNFQVTSAGAVQAATGITSSGTITFSSLDCSANANGGALTANASGVISCSDDDGGSGGSTSINTLSGALTLQGTTNEIEITDNGTDTLTVGLPNDVTISNNLTVTGNGIFNSNVSVGAGISPGNLLSVGALTTADASGQLAISTGSTTSEGIIIQSVASQTADFLQAQDSSGNVLAAISADGSFRFKELSVAPTTPSTGFGQLYVMNDGKIYFKNDGGTAYDLTATGGGGGGTVTKKLTPEFAGGTLSEDGTNNSGVMTADHVTGLASAEGYKHNYYEWKTDSTTNQDYDIIVNYQLPSDFNATNEFSTSSWKVWTYADSTTDGSLAITVEDADLGTACVASENITPSTNLTWEQITLTTNPNTNCAFNPNDMITITVKMTSKDNGGNKPVRLGEIEFAYDQ